MGENWKNAKAPHLERSYQFMEAGNLILSGALEMVLQTFITVFYKGHQVVGLFEGKLFCFNLSF